MSFQAYMDALREFQQQLSADGLRQLQARQKIDGLEALCKFIGPIEAGKALERIKREYQGDE